MIKKHSKKAYQWRIISFVFAGVFVFFSGFLSFAAADDDVPTGIEGDSFQLRENEYADDQDEDEGECGAGSYYSNGKCIPFNMDDCCEGDAMLFEDGQCHTQCQCVSPVADNPSIKVCTCEDDGVAPKSECSSLSKDQLCCDHGFMYNSKDRMCYTSYECADESGNKVCSYGGFSRPSKLSCPATNPTDDFDKPEKCCEDGYQYLNGKCYNYCACDDNGCDCSQASEIKDPVECDDFGACCPDGQTYMNGKCYTGCTLDDTGKKYTCDPGNSTDPVTDPTACAIKCCEDGYVYREGKCYAGCTVDGEVYRCQGETKDPAKPCKKKSSSTDKCCPEGTVYKDGYCYNDCACTDGYCTCTGLVGEPDSDCELPTNACCEEGYYYGTDAAEETKCFQEAVCEKVKKDPNCVDPDAGTPGDQCPTEDKCTWSGVTKDPHPSCKKKPCGEYR